MQHLICDACGTIISICEYDTSKMVIEFKGQADCSDLKQDLCTNCCKRILKVVKTELFDIRKEHQGGN